MTIEKRNLKACQHAVYVIMNELRSVCVDVSDIDSDGDDLSGIAYWKDVYAWLNEEIEKLDK